MSQLKYYDVNTSSWLPVLAGAQGTTGAQGIQGIQGPQGTPGAGTQTPVVNYLDGGVAHSSFDISYDAGGANSTADYNLDAGSSVVNF
jgi:hypothetical protein